MTSPFTIFQQLPCKTCHSECCYHVPVHRSQIEAVFEYLKTLSDEAVERLRKMKRPAGMCPFVDIEKWSCSVYPARPEVCKLFGYTPQMTCSHAPDLANTMTTFESYKRFGKEIDIESMYDVTILGTLFTWENIAIEFSETPNLES